MLSKQMSLNVVKADMICHLKWRVDSFNS